MCSGARYRWHSGVYVHFGASEYKPSAPRLFGWFQGSRGDSCHRLVLIRVDSPRAFAAVPCVGLPLSQSGK
eukprot:10948032-Prorocentrum_lima.AAC.1